MNGLKKQGQKDRRTQCQRKNLRSPAGAGSADRMLMSCRIWIQAQPMPLQRKRDTQREVSEPAAETLSVCASSSSGSALTSLPRTQMRSVSPSIWQVVRVMAL